MALTTGSVYDNYWVSHHIPRSDFQYSWITASILHSNPYPEKVQTYGHAPADGIVSSSVGGFVPAYNFVSASEFGSYDSHDPVHGHLARFWGADKATSVAADLDDQFIPIDFVGINTNIYEPVTSSQNALGYPTLAFENLHGTQTSISLNYINQTFVAGKPTAGDETWVKVSNSRHGLTSLLNGLLLHRNGPYGYPSWKQTRTSEHPVARKHRRTNILPVQDLPKVIDALEGIKPMRADTFIQYNEPPATSKFKPLVHVLFEEREVPARERRIREMTGESTAVKVPYAYIYTHANKMNMFSYPNLNTRLDLKYQGGTMYDKLYRQYTLLNALNRSDLNLDSLLYTEDIYPREINTFLGRSRKREKYVVDFWRTTRLDREQTNAKNAQNQVIGSSSIFILDGRKSFSTTSQLGITANSSDGDGAGELQNGYTTFHEGDSCITSYLNDNATLTLNTFNNQQDEYVEIIPGESYDWFDYPSSGSTTAGQAVNTTASGSFSISAWFKTAAKSASEVTSHMGIVSKYIQKNNQKQYNLWINSNGTLRGQCGSANFNSGKVVTDNQWHHGLLTSDGVQANLWLDGVFVAYSGITSLHTDHTSSVLIGATGSTDFGSGGGDTGTPGDYALGAFFTGSINHVSFWNTFLTASVTNNTASGGDIYDIYNGGCPTDLMGARGAKSYVSSSILFNGDTNTYLRSDALGPRLSTPQPTAANPLGSDNYSISIWFRSTGSAGGAAYQYLYYNGATTNQIGINADSGYIGSQLNGGSAQSTNVAAYGIINGADGRWHNVVHTARSDKGGYMFVDGVQYGGNLSVGTNEVTSGPVFWGAKDDGTQGFCGYIDEISVWNTELDSGAVTELYNLGAPTNLHNHTSASNLLTWYRMGDDPRDSVHTSPGMYNIYSKRIYDQTLNKYHATPTNFTNQYGIVKHGPEALDGWFRFNKIDQWHNLGEEPPAQTLFTPAYVYMENLREHSGISGVTASYARIKGFNRSPTNNFTLGVFECSQRFITCSVGAIYARRTPEIHTASGEEMGIFAGDTLYEADIQSGKTPFYDSYDDYREDFRGYAKNYTILPEYRVSEHMDYYMTGSGGGEYNFLDKREYGFLSITGSNISSSADDDFFVKYSHSDFLKYFDVIEDDHEIFSKEAALTLRLNVIRKFLPYKGFYPVDRTLQLATLFSQSYEPYVNPSDYAGNMVPWPFGTQPAWRTFMAPIFGPGILYNSIKSGVAVDWPQMTASFMTTGRPGSTEPLDVDYGGLLCSPRVDDIYHTRIPFEALVEPENHLTVRLRDMEMHPSSSLDSFIEWDGQGDKLYKMAMNNFLAESINFFLADRNVTTIVSAPDDDPKHFNAEAGKEYKMRVVLRNSMLSRKARILENTPGFPFGQLSGSAITKPTITMYDRASAFGPPSVAYNVYRKESYEPFTPPYYDGYSEVECTFKPTESRRYFIDEIVSQMEVSYYRIAHQFMNTTSAASGSRMQISASINFDTVRKTKALQYDEAGRVLRAEEREDNPSVWMIQPKWETPILDFTNASITLPTYGSGSVSKGMWHQYGSEPAANKGIYLEVQDLMPSELINSTTTSSLATLVGFGKDSHKLGVTAGSRTIREAVVAVPFQIVQNEPRFFKLTRSEIDVAKFRLGMTGGKDLPGVEVGQTIVDMVESMNKYVFPPNFDFLTYDLETVEPFAMYIFEFEYILSKQDLTDIWQNLSPVVGRRFESKRKTIQHKLLKNEFFECQEGRLPDRLQWMVFKVKQKAEKNYFDKIGKSVWDDKYETFYDYVNQPGTRNYKPPYSYNWPYDFFSLIEMAKLEATVEVKPGEFDVIPTTKTGRGRTPPVVTPPFTLKAPFGQGDRAAIPGLDQRGLRAGPGLIDLAGGLIGDMSRLIPGGPTPGLIVPEGLFPPGRSPGLPAGGRGGIPGIGGRGGLTDPGGGRGDGRGGLGGGRGGLGGRDLGGVGDDFDPGSYGGL